MADRLAADVEPVEVVLVVDSEKDEIEYLLVELVYFHYDDELLLCSDHHSSSNSSRDFPSWGVS